MRTIWWNGKLLPESEARISIYDSSLVWGDMIFEMTRSFNRVHFKLREHLERLWRSAKYVRIDIPYSMEEIEKVCNDIAIINQPEFKEDDEHRLMINVTRGLLPIYEQTGRPGANVIISDFPLRWTTKGIGRLFDEGINCIIPSQRAIPASLLEPKVKNRSRLHYKMASLEIGDRGWPLLLDEDGFITEGPGWNFFIIKEDKLITPEGRNILRGISRQTIMDMIIVEERNIEPYDVYEADEAFVTATPFCILPATSLNGTKMGDGTIGLGFKSILNKWNELVGINIKQQIQDWDAERIRIPEYRIDQPLFEKLLDVRA